jgi:hypothetical protein
MRLSGSVLGIGGNETSPPPSRERVVTAPRVERVARRVPEARVPVPVAAEIGRFLAEAMKKVGNEASSRSRRRSRWRPSSRWSKACSSTAAQLRAAQSPYSLARDEDAIRLVLGLGLAVFDRVSVPFQLFGALMVDLPAMRPDQERLDASCAEYTRDTAEDICLKPLYVHLDQVHDSAGRADQGVESRDLDLPRRQWICSACSDSQRRDQLSKQTRDRTRRPTPEQHAAVVLLQEQGLAVRRPDSLLVDRKGGWVSPFR